jgi:hypothetical protein
MTDKALPVEDKIHGEEEVVRVEMTDEERRILDKRVTYKTDIRIMPWIIVCCKFFFGFTSWNRTRVDNVQTYSTTWTGQIWVSVSHC